MSNLSQFFATGGNKIKRIQRVQATQASYFDGFNSYYRWTGVTATISAVDVNKTILVYNTNASNSAIIKGGSGGIGDPVTYISSYIQYNHYAFLTNSTTISFNGPQIGSNQFGIFTNTLPAQLEVQIIEFE